MAGMVKWAINDGRFCGVVCSRHTIVCEKKQTMHGLAWITFLSLVLRYGNDFARYFINLENQCRITLPVTKIVIHANLCIILYINAICIENTKLFRLHIEIAVQSITYIKHISQSRDKNLIWIHLCAISTSGLSLGKSLRNKCRPTATSVQHNFEYIMVKVSFPDPYKAVIWQHMIWRACWHERWIAWS